MPRHPIVLVAALLLLAGIATAQATTRPKTFDPLSGLDADGRIPKPQLPGDLPNPERWRYTPAGRIAPGNVFERFLVSSFFSPVVFREDDIGFGGGFAFTDLDFRNQRYREFANIVMTHSEEGQQAYSIFWARWLHHRDLASGGIVREERGRVFARAGYGKTLTRRFFGFGSRTPASAETSFTHETSEVGLGVRDALFEPGGDWLYQAELLALHHNLSRGRVSTVPGTDQVYPELTASGDGNDELLLVASFAHDTRDSLHQPYSGHRLGVSTHSSWHSGGEYGAVFGVDARHYLTVPPLFHRGAAGDEENPPTDTVAIGGFVQDTIGELPFYSLPSLGGGDTLRSFVPNRFTDRAVAHASVEYRFGIIPRGITFTDTVRIERVSLALFHEWGAVAADLDGLDDARWHHSTGVGLRLGFAREAIFRLDIGYGDEGSNFTLAFGNSF
ncbi:MAG: BamA/TamA family outer membrane protein [Planctomycetes bacterium]|nr:BamA/TamA family outer membrane protein [Planctomycetota bacterium]